MEGPFISREKRGAHPESHIRNFEDGAFKELLKTYGSLDNVAIVTLAPELTGSHEVIKELTTRGICVSVGESRLGCVYGANSFCHLKAPCNS